MMDSFVGSRMRDFTGIEVAEDTNMDDTFHYYAPLFRVDLL